MNSKIVIFKKYKIKIIVVIIIDLIYLKYFIFIIQLDLDNFKNQVNVLGLENHVNTLDKENANNKVKISELLTQIELLKDENSKIVNEKDNIIKEMNDEHLQLMYFFLIQEFNTQIRK